MPALTKDRNTLQRSGDVREFPVAANAVIFAGAMVALNASRNLVPAATATTLKVVGRAEKTVVNTGGADGAVSCPVGAGIYRYENSAAGDAITRSHIGQTVFAVDDNTVALTNGTNTRSAAGTVFDVDAAGVWVKFS